MISKEKSGRGVTETLAAFASEVTFEDLPKEVIHQTKRVICDSLGCILGGYSTERARIIKEHIKKLGGNPQSTIIGSGEKTSCANAALANACIGNALDWDDVFFNGSHPAIPTVCPALALAESEGATGKDLITAVAVGYDVAVRIGASTYGLFDVDGDTIRRRPVMGFVWHVFCGAVSAAKILRLDEQRMIQTFGLAVMRTPIPSNAKCFSVPERLPLSKYYDAGWIAQAGVTSALLAQSGYTGPTTVLDGENGFWRMIGSDEVDFDFMVDQLGEKWWIKENSFKPWPNCRPIHHALTAFIEIIEENDIAGGEIEKVVVKNSLMLTPLYKILDPEWINMQFNLYHALANAAYRIKPSPRWQYPESITDPKRHDFRRKIYIEANPETVKAIVEDMTTGYPKKTKRLPTTVEVSAKGKTFRKSVEYAKGDPWLSETVMTDEELKEKFRANASEISALSTSWMEKTEEAIDKIYNLEEIDNIDRLTNLLS